MTAIIEVDNVTKAFGAVTALAGIDLAVDEGAVVALLGPNGAGKTTLVRVLATLLRPDSGRARVGGHDVVHDPQAARTLIGLAGQAAAVDPLLTGRENVEMVGRLYGLPRRDARQRAADVLDTLRLGDAADRLVRAYSGGTRRRLDLGASLVGRPRVLLLDEPTTGLDPATRLDLWELVAGFVRDGTTVLLTTQYLEEADRLASRIVVADGGHVIADGSGHELKARLAADVIDVRLHLASQADTAVAALAPTATTQPHVDRDNRLITIAANDGPATLMQTLRQLDEAGVHLEDIALRRPSLDDVFLALTGRVTSTEQPEANPLPKRHRERVPA